MLGRRKLVTGAAALLPFALIKTALGVGPEEGAPNVSDADVRRRGDAFSGRIPPVPGDVSPEDFQAMRAIVADMRSWAVKHGMGNMAATPEFPHPNLKVNTLQAGRDGVLVLGDNDGTGLYLPVNNTIVRQTSTITISNTTAETDLFSFTIPGKTLTLTNGLRLTLSGDFLNNEATARDFTWRIKFGATTLWGDAVTSLSAASAAVRPWRLTIELVNLGATNSQQMTGLMILGSSVAPSLAGIGDGTGASLGTPSGASAIDTTAAAGVVLAVSGQMSNANASANIIRRYATLERI